MPYSSVKDHRPFNEGSDARLDGLPPRCCPYRSKSYQFKLWMDGWNHVDREWGSRFPGRVRTLPIIPESDRERQYRKMNLVKGECE